jgi:hypothetical protein
MSVPPSGRLISIRWNGSTNYTHASFKAENKLHTFRCVGYTVVLLLDARKNVIFCQDKCTFQTLSISIVTDTGLVLRSSFQRARVVYSTERADVHYYLVYQPICN